MPTGRAAVSASTPIVRALHRGALLLLSLVLAAAGGCAVNPVTGKKELNLLSESQEIEMGGKQYVPTQQSQGGRYLLDPPLNRYVSEVGQRIARHSDRPLPYEFVLLDNSVPNAWALPGGKIAVNRGLLVELESEAELAAVLGHEIVHAAARHGARAVERGLLLQGVVIATAVYGAEREHGNAIVQGAALGAQLVGLKYGRDAEREADYYGMKYMAEAGYDPQAAVKLQETFVKLSEGRESNWLEGLFASHPPSPERVASNRQRARELNVGGEWGRERYQERIAYLQRSRPAYDAFDEAREHLAKEDLELAMASLDRAIALEPREAHFYSAEGAILLQQKRNRAALDRFARAVELNGDYFQNFLGRGLAHARLGNSDAARADFERSNELLPTALAMNELGKIALAAGERGSAKSYFKAASEAGGAPGEEATREYVRLDLPDNPNDYIKSQALFSKGGRLLVDIVNRSDVDVTDVEVRVRARVGEQTITRRYSVEQLSGGGRARIDTGLETSEADPIRNVEAVVLGISL